jgi:hypothetical protein
VPEGGVKVLAGDGVELAFRLPAQSGQESWRLVFKTKNGNDTSCKRIWQHPATVPCHIFLSLQNALIPWFSFLACDSVICMGSHLAAGTYSCEELCPRISRMAEFLTSCRHAGGGAKCLAVRVMA